MILLVISALLWVYNNQLLKITKKRLVLDLLHVCGFLAVLAYYNAGYIFRQLNVHTLFVTLEDLQIDIVHLIWSLVFVQLVGLGVSGIELYHQQKSSSMQILKVAQVFLQVLLLYAGSETHAWTILMNFLALIFTTLYLYWRKIDSSIEEVKILGISLYLLFACRNVFYQTSHGLSFDQLQLSVGFIGQKTFQFYYAGFALALNTFSSEVLLVLFFAMIPRNFKLAMRFNLILRMSMVLMSAVVAFVLRRHLMVWAIFAPKVSFVIIIKLLFETY